MSMAKVAKTRKGRAFIQKLQGAIDTILYPPVRNQQRVDVADSNPPAPFDRLAVPTTKISNALVKMQTRDPMAKWQLIKTKYVHQRQTKTTLLGGFLP